MSEGYQLLKVKLNNIITFIYRGIAIYVHILLRILRRDIMQFGLVFSAALYAFGGGFYFALRSEVREVFDAATNETRLVTDLDINPQETG